MINLFVRFFSLFVVGMVMLLIDNMRENKEKYSILELVVMSFGLVTVLIMNLMVVIFGVGIFIN
ncbi:MAG: hypothetical protein MR911_10830 [Spirochaetia bacterium]|nr:hypothetical protein [Spirochaetia bacterium]